MLFHWLTPLAGAALILLALADVYMTVLYARAGTGPLSHRLASGSWAVFRRLSRLLGGWNPDWKGAVLSFAGPSYLVLLLSTWVGLLLLGFTLVAWANLGAGVRSTSGQTPTDFVSALYYAGASLTTVGTGDFRPVSTPAKLLAVIDSLLGISVVTFSLTYVMQIYTALHRRNTLGLALHHASSGTGDAAVLLANLGAGDDFSHGISPLAGLAADTTTAYESHHFYSVLVYFRFKEPHYAMARGTLMTMEMITLINTALDPERHGWLKSCAVVSQLREGTMHVLTEFATVYLPGGPPEMNAQSDQTLAHWRWRFHAAVDHLRRQGISVTPNEEHDVERYIEFRRQWDPFAMAFAHYMEHTPAEIDPAGVRPDETAKHREMPAPPLKAAG